MARAVLVANETIERLKLVMAQAEAKLEEYRPKAGKVRVMSRKPPQSFLYAAKRCI